MHRFFLPNAPGVGEAFELPKSEAHHAVSVLRLREGDKALVLDGRGRRLHCEVAACGRRQVRLRALEETREPRGGCELILAQSIIKGKAMDLVVQKATELGVSRIAPILTERTVARPDAREFGAKREKWRDVAIEACKQCGAVWLPEIDEPTALEDALSLCGKAGRLSLAAALEGDAVEIAAGFEAYGRKESRPPESLAIWIGPEGDFTAGELLALKKAGAVPVTLGGLTLRSETAALCALSIAGAALRAANAGR